MYMYIYLQVYITNLLQEIFKKNDDTVHFIETVKKFQPSEAQPFFISMYYTRSRDL